MSNTIEEKKLELLKLRESLRQEKYPNIPPKIFQILNDFLSGLYPVELEDGSTFDHLKIPMVHLQGSVFSPIDDWFKNKLTMQESSLVEKNFLYYLSMTIHGNTLYADFHKWYQNYAKN